MYLVACSHFVVCSPQLPPHSSEELWRAKEAAHHLPGPPKDFLGFQKTENLFLVGEVAPCGPWVAQGAGLSAIRITEISEVYSAGEMGSFSMSHTLCYTAILRIVNIIIFCPPLIIRMDMLAEGIAEKPKFHTKKIF